MATSTPTDGIEIVAIDDTQSPSQISLVPATENSDEQEFAERPLEVSTEIMKDEPQLQDPTISISQGGHLGGTNTEFIMDQQPTPSPESPAPESVPAVLPGTESSVTTSEPSLTLGAPVQIAAISTSEHDLPHEQLPVSNVSTHRDAASYQSPPLEITGESSLANTFPSVVGVGSTEQSTGQGLFKCIFLECSSAHQFSEELTLSVIRNENSETLNAAKVSATKWKIVESIIFHQNAGDMTLIVQSKVEGDVAFLTFSEDELYALGCTEEDTIAERVFVSMTEDDSISVKITFAVATSRARTINAAATEPNFMVDFRRAMNSALASEHRFKVTGNIDDINQAIFHFEIAVLLLPPGSNILPVIFNNIGKLYSTCLQHTGDIQNLDLAISHYQRAVESTPPGHASVAISFQHLGDSYATRFQLSGETHDIDRAICHFETCIKSTPPGHPFLPHWHYNLGTSYLLRFKSKGDLQDIDFGIPHLKSALNSIPRSDAGLPNLLNALGISYAKRFLLTSDLQDIDCAISYHQSAVESTPSGHSSLPSWFSKLGVSYSCRFKHSKNMQDINHAISHLQRAVNSTPSSNHNLPHALNNFRPSRDASNSQDTMDRATSHQQRGTEPTPINGHDEFRSWLSWLGDSYTQRFEHTGDLRDNDHAIFYLRKALESTPFGDDKIPARFSRLGGSYSGRFKHTGDLQDIDHAISYLQRTVESTPSGHAELPCALSDLGKSYRERFTRTQDVKDINFAILHQENAVKSTHGNESFLPTLLGNLSASHLSRFDRFKILQDIDIAISYLQRAVESTPSGHTDLPTWLNNLGNSYRARFEYTGDLQDIDRGISHHKSAVESTPYGHVNLPGWLNNLGLSYAERFKFSGDLVDIDCAISHQRSAVESSPSDNANLSGFIGNLGRYHELRFQRTQDFPDAQNCIAFNRQAAEANGSPYIRLTAASRAAKLSSEHNSSDSSCLTDFSLAISLLSEVAGLEQTIHRRHSNLRGQRTSIVATAVATALRFNKPDLALEWLEQGRCLVWNQLNQLRAPIDNLQMSNPSLANRFIKVANALGSDGTRSAFPIQPSHFSFEDEVRIQDDTRNHTLHAAEYRQLLEEIRDLPDFHDFLQPTKAIHLLSSLPFDGPVVIFNLHETRCDALAFMAGIEEPLHIPLENFSLSQAKELQQCLQSNLLDPREAEDGDRATFRLDLNAPFSMSLILEELWHKVAQPILKALGYRLESFPNHSERSRIWWCPTGNLSFLPLHAAGIYSSAYQSGQCVSDFVVSSYTPSVHSLNEKCKGSPTSFDDTGLILISQPNTPGLPSINWTRKETHDIQALMDGSGVNALLLEDAGATIDKVKKEMKGNNWIHFACHGIQDENDPLKSGIHLHDGRLELLEIMRQQILNPDLAFLSACQTSKGDLDLSEEVVHLAAGMLAVGYRGVVGTMWSISDIHGPEFATEFYQYLLKEKGESKGLDSTRAAYALDYATRKVRESLGHSEAAFLTWVPYIHFGY